jgi:hypothetical protein
LERLGDRIFVVEIDDLDGLVREARKLRRQAVLARDCYQAQLVRPTARRQPGQDSGQNDVAPAARLSCRERAQLTPTEIQGLLQPARPGTRRGRSRASSVTGTAAASLERRA